MDVISSVTANDYPALVNDTAVARPSISWGSVFGGVAAAVAVQIGLSQLGLSLGLGLYAAADPGSSIQTIAISGALALVASAIVSLFIGGWVAGRLARNSSRVDAAIHGGLVWALCGIVGIIFVTTAAGAVMGGAVFLAGDGVNAVATGAAAAAPAAKELVAPTWDAVKTQVESETAKADKDKPSDDRLAGRSRLMELLASSFSTDSSPQQKQNEKDELIAGLASQTGVSPVAAARAYEQWQRTWQEANALYQTKKLELEAKAKQVAAVVAKRTSQAALYAFLATLFGLAAAGGGAVLAREWLCRRDIIVGYTIRPTGTAHSDRVFEKDHNSAELTHSTR